MLDYYRTALTKYAAVDSPITRSVYPMGVGSAPKPAPTPSTPYDPVVAQIRKNQDDAYWQGAVEGFNDGYLKAMKGDGWRGLARGSLNTTAEVIDSISDIAGDALTNPGVLYGKIKYLATGDKSTEEKFVKARDFINKKLPGGYVVHKLTDGLRWLAARKGLDPKELDPEDYKLSEYAGNGAVYGAEAALTGKAFGALKGWPWLRRLLITEEAVRAANATTRGVESAIDQQAAEIEAQRQLQEDYQKKITRIQQSIGTAAGMGIAGIGTYGLTSVIPKLRKKKALRLLISSLAAIPGGYIGYKAATPK